VVGQNVLVVMLLLLLLLLSWLRGFVLEVWVQLWGLSY
jgi:hypothetical protein